MLRGVHFFAQLLAALHVARCGVLLGDRSKAVQDPQWSIIVFSILLEPSIAWSAVLRGLPAGALWLGVASAL